MDADDIPFLSMLFWWHIVFLQPFIVEWFMNIYAWMIKFLVSHDESNMYIIFFLKETFDNNKSYKYIYEVYRLMGILFKQCFLKWVGRSPNEMVYVWYSLVISIVNDRRHNKLLNGINIWEQFPDKGEIIWEFKWK